MAGEKKVVLYVAGPLGFTEAGRFFYYERLIPAIRELGYEVLDPWQLTSSDKIKKVQQMPYGPERREAWKKLNMEIGENNINAIDMSTGMVAVLDGPDVDSGTASEVGYGYGNNEFIGRYPIVGYRSDFRLGENEGTNLNVQVEYFIRASGGTIVSTIDELKKELKRLFG